jgi:hypothetical protein
MFELILLASFVWLMIVFTGDPPTRLCHGAQQLLRLWSRSRTTPPRAQHPHQWPARTSVLSCVHKCNPARVKNACADHPTSRCV